MSDPDAGWVAALDQIKAAFTTVADVTYAHYEAMLLAGFAHREAMELTRDWYEDQRGTMHDL